jgi:hypothetical protein
VVDHADLLPANFEPRISELGKEGLAMDLGVALDSSTYSSIEFVVRHVENDSEGLQYLVRARLSVGCRRCIITRPASIGSDRKRRGRELCDFSLDLSSHQVSRRRIAVSERLQLAIAVSDPSLVPVECGKQRLVPRA